MTDDTLRRPLQARAPARRRRHGDRPARVRHAPGAQRRGQAAGRAPGRGRELRLALPPRGARRRAARAPEHRPGLRLRPRRRRRPASFIVMEFVDGRVLRRDPARPRAARHPRRGRRSSPRPAAGSTTRTATASCTATSSPATCCAAATTPSSSPTSASPRRPSSPTSRRSARCSAPRRTSRPSRRAASRPAPRSDLYALGVVSYQLLAGRLPYEAASLTDLARLQETAPPPRLDELNPDVPSRAGGGDHGRAAPRPRAPLRRRRRHGAGAGRCVARQGSGARHGKHMGDGRHGGHAHAGRHAGHHRHAAARAPAPPARADQGGAAAPPSGARARGTAPLRPPPARRKPAARA